MSTFDRETEFAKSTKKSLQEQSSRTIFSQRLIIDQDYKMYLPVRRILGSLQVLSEVGPCGYNEFLFCAIANFDALAFFNPVVGQEE